jgi:hydroxyacylglutathione hydrolase
MLQLLALPALQDNYIWVLAAPDGRALVIDPGATAPVEAAAQRGLRPVAIALTHHHADHVAGAGALRERWRIPVHAPHDDRIADVDERVGAGGVVRVPELGIALDVLEVPGHTRSHVAFVGDGRLFCGDTLFSLGCGRLFEGSPAQMLESLDRLAALPDATEVCCGHEYTLANAAFALAVEPDNAAIDQRRRDASLRRAANEPSLPSRLDDERAANPFLRCDQPDVIESAARRLGHAPRDRVETFATLRAWKDGFRTA